MIHRLATVEGAALYKRRGATVEPANGHLKDRIALGRFTRLGLAACQAELDFAATVLNLGKLLRLDPARRSAALPARNKAAARLAAGRTITRTSSAPEQPR